MTDLRACVFVFLLLLVPAVASADDIDWLVAPYGWLPSIGLERSGDSGGGGIGISSGSSLLDKTESFFKFRAEVARNRWGINLDYITISLTDQVVLSAPPPLSLSIDVETNLDLDVIELGGFYRPSGKIHGVNYLFGIRHIGADMTLFVMPSIGPAQRVDSDASVSDLYFGARYVHQISNRWTGSVRGDYSVGDSEGTLNLLASVSFDVAGPFALQGGYRHVVIEFKENEAGSPVTTEIELSGPYVGFVFRF